MGMTCEACGSDRVLRGPFYSQEDIVCMDCGHREEVAEVNFAPDPEELEQERAQAKMSEAAEVLQQELTMEIMSDPKKMEEYLKKLKQATEVVNDQAESKEKKPRSRKKGPAPTGQGEVESQAEFGIVSDLIWQAIHVYVRKGSTWQAVLKEARDEKEYRNDNVILFAHEHSFGESCESKNCKQV